MSLILGQTLVGTTATFITTVPPGAFALTLVTGGSAVAIGTGTAVTFSTGALINVTAFVQYQGFPSATGTSIYGVTATGSATVSYHLSTDT